MSFAFPALLLLLIVLPGVILRYTYLRGFFANSPFSITSLADEAAYGLIGSIFLHFVWASLLALCGVQFNLSPLVALLIGSYGHDDVYFPLVLDWLTRHPERIIGYFLSLYVLAALLGYGAHQLVRGRRWDRTFPWLRFRNDWHYLISGEILQFPEVGREPREVDGVYLSAVVHHGGDSYLYRGIVADYFFDKSGSLDRVLLRLAHRRLLARDREPGEPRSPSTMASANQRYYDIAGDFFVLRYSEVQTINIEYFALTESVAPPTP